MRKTVQPGLEDTCWQCVWKPRVRYISHVSLKTSKIFWHITARDHCSRQCFSIFWAWNHWILLIRTYFLIRRDGLHQKTRYVLLPCERPLFKIVFQHFPNVKPLDIANQDTFSAGLQQQQICLMRWDDLHQKTRHVLLPRERPLFKMEYFQAWNHWTGQLPAVCGDRTTYFWRDVVVVCSRKPGIFKPSQRPVFKRVFQHFLAWHHWMLFTSHQDIFQRCEAATKPDMFDEMLG